MPPKRPTSSRPSPPPDEWKITDEWGIYDPEKAGIPALFKRLGRPVLRAAGSSARKERRRALRPQRSAEGVGLVLNEVRARAGLLPHEEHPYAAGNPARAMRLALKAQAAATAVDTPPAVPFVPPPAPAGPPSPPPDTPVPDAAEARPAAAALDAPEAAVPARKRPTRRGVAPRPAPHSEPAARPRSRRAAPRAKVRESGPSGAAAPEPAPAPATPGTPAHAHAVPGGAAGAQTPRPGPPAPSPRRPRGPVPLAAWARAVVDQPATPSPDPRRADKRGFWRGIFRIPSEVALVEYARGCRIHRLLVEAGDDHVPDFI